MRSKRRIHQPQNRLQHGVDSLIHVLEVNVRQVIAGLVIIAVQSVA